MKISIFLLINIVYISISFAQNNLVFRIIASGCQYNENSLKSNYSTGFVYKENGRVVGILTALHGVCGCNSITAEDSNGKKLYSLKVTKADITSDIALLHSTEIISNYSTGYEFSALSASSLTGKDVTIYGYPFGRQIILKQRNGKISEPSTGTLKQFVKPENINPLSQRGSPGIYEDVLNLEAEIAPGQSGSPIIYNGQVVGIGNGGLGGGTSHACWAIPVRDIQLLPIGNLAPEYTNLKSRNPNNLFLLTCSLDEKESSPTKEILMSMVGADIVAQTPDANTNSPNLITKSYNGQKGGYIIESRVPTNRENGVAYLKKVFALPSGYRSMTIDVGQGRILTYDRSTGRILTPDILGIRFPGKDASRISYIDYECRVYLGNQRGPGKDIWDSSNQVLKFGTYSSERTQNPRNVYPPTENFINLAGNNEMTCICEYSEARKDDYHSIEIPHSIIKLIK